MRADSHYVDSLAGASRAERPTATRDRQMLDQLIEDVAAIEAAAAMLASETSPLARRVSLDLIKAQSARASWLLRAQTLVGPGKEDLEPQGRPRPIGTVLASIRDRISAECRLSGVMLQARTDDSTVVVVDEALLATGITGAVLALLPFVTGVEGALIRIEAVVEPDGQEDDLQAIEISQEVVPVSASTKQRFFEAGWPARPGGWLAATGATVAQAAAERLGGRVTLVTGQNEGCIVRFGFA